MKIKLCRLCLSAIAAVFVSVFAFADGGPNASKAVDGKSLTLEEFQGSDTLMNRDGSLLVILRSKGQPGAVTLKATSAAFAPLALGLKTQR